MADQRANAFEKAKEIGKSLLNAVSGIVYSDIAKDYAARGATEISNVLFTGNSYGPGSSMAPSVPEPEPAAAEPAEPQKTYDEVLREAAQRGGNDNDRGRSR